MALTKEDLRAIGALMDEKLVPVMDELAEIKEHAEVTRSATNSLVEWADTVGVITQVKFLIKKQMTVEEKVLFGL